MVCITLLFSKIFVYILVPIITFVHQIWNKFIISLTSSSWILNLNCRNEKSSNKIIIIDILK